MAYAAMLCRDLDRLADVKKRMNVLPLGSGALAGTTYPIDRQMVAAQLGFDEVSANSLDGVSDRDFCIELAAALSLVMVHLSRFSEEIIMWCSWEFKFVELDDAFSTGSSIMPQKKNPDIAELVRGKSGRVFGDLTTLLTVMKGIALAYNKDMQEDKEAIFDAVDTVKMCLHAFTPMIDTMTVLKDNMRAAAAKGFINATDCADYLVGKGLPFRDAYKATGELVAQCIDRGLTLETLPLEDYRAVCDLFDQDVYHKINLDTCVATRISEGGPCPESVEQQIGKNCADLIHDGDCLQLGIGGIPNAVCAQLWDKKDLGLHSELVCDGVVDLLEAGVINNAKKQIHRGRTVIGAALGTDKLNAYINNNPSVEMHPINYVNNPSVIAKNDNVVSINSCLQVDLLGQVVADTVGLNQFSAVGGQVDFVRGATMSRGGRSIIAMPSTAKRGHLSRIVPIITEGSAITTPRNDVNYVVTEYGVAHLRGRSLGERARQLIAIAHPAFRDELTFEAKKRGIMI